MGKVIAITGAAGYVGRALVEHLQKQHWVERIVALDLKPLPATGVVIPYNLDVRDTSFLRAVLAEHAVTHLVHAAFVVSQPLDMTLEQMRRINVEGSQGVIHQALESGIEHLTFLSSAAVYGYRGDQPPVVKEHASAQPNMVYGKHKIEVERYLTSQQPFYPRTQVAILRPVAVVGPRGREQSHLRALTAQPVFVLSNSGQARTQAIHEDDLTTLLSTVLERNVTGIFNAAPDDSASWAEIGKLTGLPLFALPRPVLNIATRLNRLLPALHGFTREVVDLFSETLVVDNTAVRQSTNWIPRYTTLEAFAQMFRESARELSSV
ncbi:MAG: NAD-dependent epimerase/dehydratase family protein [Anaerolineae bacterium]|nr:NAD-dependent epimerase/dehydratase family protein [Anaerolineae bacterium]